MPPDTFPFLLQALNAFLDYQRRQTLAQEKIALGLGRLTLSAAMPSPNYTRSLSEFQRFDWASIGATVIQHDNHGAAIVRWGDRDYVRRSPNNKFGEAIWFSRSSGRDELGNTTYERLITFKPMSKAEPVPTRISQHLAPSP